MRKFKDLFKKETSNTQKIINNAHNLIEELENDRVNEKQEKSKNSFNSIKKTNSKLFNEILSEYFNKYSESVNKFNDNIKESIEYFTYYLDKYDNGINSTNENLKKYYNFDVSFITNKNIENIFYSVIVKTISNNFFNAKDKNKIKNYNKYLLDLLNEVIECMEEYNEENNEICSQSEWINIINKLIDNARTVANDAFNVDFHSISPTLSLQSIKIFADELVTNKKELQNEEIRRNVLEEMEKEKRNKPAGLNR